MKLQFDTITGIAIGIEYVSKIEEENIPPTIIIDLLFLRILVQWEPK